MRVIALLCDAAEVSDGKLYILGGGWNLVTAGASSRPTALALLFEVPWDMANQIIRFSVRLVDSDGRPVTLPGPLGAAAVQAGAQLEVGRPPGIKRGSELNVPFVVNVPPLQLQPDTRYVWVVEVDGDPDSTVSLAFQTRPAG